MLLYRPAMSDWMIVALLYFLIPISLCLAIIVLWVNRKEDSEDKNVQNQNLQAKVGIGLAVVGWIITYGLIIGSEKIEPDVQNTQTKIIHANQILIT